MITAQRIVDGFEWMIIDMKHRHDDLKGTLGEGSQSDYSNELEEAMAVMSILKRGGEAIAVGERHHHINCRNRDCKFHVKGDCAVESHTFTPKGNHTVCDLICVEAEEREKRNDDALQISQTKN